MHVRHRGRPVLAAVAALALFALVATACGSGNSRAGVSGSSAPFSSGALSCTSHNSDSASCAADSGLSSNSHSAPNSAAPWEEQGDRQVAPRKVADATTSVPVSALVAAQDPKLAVNGPRPIDTPPLTLDGKPRIVYFGGEFCPYCAADRWVTVVALSQFGQWHDLQVTRSSADDVAPNTPTFSFHGTSYTSQYLAFSGFEVRDRAGKPLDSVPEDLQTLPATVANAVNDPNFSANSIPFTDFGGKFVQSGAPFDPSILAGKSWQDVADALHTPDSPIAKTILANAADLVKDLCTLTGGQPGDVCSAFSAS